MKYLNKISKKIRGNHILALLAVVVLCAVFYNYSNRKWMVSDGMAAQQSSGQANPVQSNPVASKPLGHNEDFAQVSNMDTTGQGLPPSCNSVKTTQPQDLLPTDSNNEWAKLNPTGNGDLNDVNLLKAGYHTGVDTVGNTLRNANLQVRSEPANPTATVSPWMNTTIEPDLQRKPLEIGCQN